MGGEGPHGWEGFNGWQGFNGWYGVEDGLCEQQGFVTSGIGGVLGGNVCVYECMSVWGWIYESVGMGI